MIRYAIKGTTTLTQRIINTETGRNFPVSQVQRGNRILFIKMHRKMRVCTSQQQAKKTLILGGRVGSSGQVREVRYQWLRR